MDLYSFDTRMAMAMALTPGTPYRGPLLRRCLLEQVHPFGLGAERAISLSREPLHYSLKDRAGAVYIVCMFFLFA